MKAAIFGLCLTLATAAAAAPSTCTAEVHATERLSDGEEIKVRRRGSRKVKPGTTYKVSYRVAPGAELLDTEFKVARCVPCAE